jgi:hypothetical protein
MHVFQIQRVEKEPTDPKYAMVLFRNLPGVYVGIQFCTENKKGERKISWDEIYPLNFGNYENVFRDNVVVRQDSDVPTLDTQSFTMSVFNRTYDILFQNGTLTELCAHDGERIELVEVEELLDVEGQERPSPVPSRDVNNKTHNTGLRNSAVFS